MWRSLIPFRLVYLWNNLRPQLKNPGYYRDQLIAILRSWYVRHIDRKCGYRFSRGSMWFVCGSDPGHELVGTDHNRIHRDYGHADASPASR